MALAGVAMALPAITGWDVHVRYFPPLHATWDPRVGWGTLPALAIAGLAVWQAIDLASRLAWRRLLVASYAAGLGWMLSLALVDGTDGIGKILNDSYEYLRTARRTTDLPHALSTFVSRIAYDGLPDSIADPNWPVHIAGHPPGAFTFFVLLTRTGLGRGITAGLVVTLIAASTAVAVMVALRALGAESVARRAAPFLVIGPAAIWQCVSADAMFAAFAAWGIAVLAIAAAKRGIAWSLLAGLLLGWTVMLSYGLPLLGLLAVAVLVVARTWKPLPWAFVAALVPIGIFTAYGYYYWDALPELHARQYAGVAHNRPPEYWMWGNYAAFVFSAGPMVGAGLAVLRRRTASIAPDARRATLWLVGATLAMTLAADASQASKGEVERIWLPFVPWLLVSCAFLPERWRRAGVVVQVVVALAVQHLLDTGW